jgi:sterol desaturase/sphingolipid hydroxylase (fatty acid hydroxylase superfamily)
MSWSKAHSRNLWPPPSSLPIHFQTSMEISKTRFVCQHVLYPIACAAAFMSVALFVHIRSPPTKYVPGHVNRAAWTSLLNVLWLSFLESFITFGTYDPFQTHHSLDQSAAMFILYGIIYMLVTDLTHYWIHVGMHTPFLYHYIHQQHHNLFPTALDFVAVHPMESTFNFMILHISSLFLPVYYGIIVWYGTSMSILSVMEHGHGFKLFMNIPWLKDLFDTNFHNIHHHSRVYNYGVGLFISLWDKLFGTYMLPQSADFE